MEHKLTGKQPKRINLEKGVFESGGTFYFINIEGMGYERLKRYAELLPIIIYGRKYFNFAQMIHDLRIKMTSGGEDFKATYFNVALELTNWDQYLLDNSGQFFDNVIDDTLRFCALFMVTKDEDMTKVDDIHVEQKITHWKSDMDMTDFFLAAKQRQAGYKDLLRTLSEEAKRKGGSLTKTPDIPEN